MNQQVCRSKQVVFIFTSHSADESQASALLEPIPTRHSFLLTHSGFTPVWSMMNPGGHSQANRWLTALVGMRSSQIALYWRHGSVF